MRAAQSQRCLSASAQRYCFVARSAVCFCFRCYCIGCSDACECELWQLCEQVAFSLFARSGCLMRLSTCVEGFCAFLDVISTRKKRIRRVNLSSRALIFLCLPFESCESCVSLSSF